MYGNQLDSNSFLRGTVAGNMSFLLALVASLWAPSGYHARGRHDGRRAIRSNVVCSSTVVTPLHLSRSHESTSQDRPTSAQPARGDFTTDSRSKRNDGLVSDRTGDGRYGRGASCVDRDCLRTETGLVADVAADEAFLDPGNGDDGTWAGDDRTDSTDADGGAVTLEVSNATTHVALPRVCLFRLGTPLALVFV